MHAPDRSTPTPAARVFAWIGAGLFVAALGYFLFTYMIVFARVTPGTPAAWPVAWNVALFSAFALHHSIFAREPVRAWVARAVPPGLERSLYVWVASLLLIAVCGLWQPVGGLAWQVGGAGAWLLRLAQLAGIGLTVRSAAAIDVLELAGVRRRTPSAPPVFRTTGPYGLVRHPIYLGWLLIVFPVTPMTLTRLVFALVSATYVLLAIPLEERSLHRTSGGAYDRYAQKVRWKVLPGIY